MADPFANLFSTFKGGEKDVDTEKSRPGVALSSQNVPHSGLDRKLSKNTELDELFESKTVASSKKTVADDLDSAFEMFNSPPPPQLPEASIEAVTQQQQTPTPEPYIVDEVKDMEIAKLMSLGMDWEKAASHYDRGILYDRLVEKKIARKSAARQANPIPSEEPDLFSLASGWLNKGRTFLDSTFRQPSDSQSVSLSQQIAARSEYSNSPFLRNSSTNSSTSNVFGRDSSTDNRSSSPVPALPSRPSRPSRSPGSPRTNSPALSEKSDSLPASLVDFEAPANVQQNEEEKLLDFDSPAKLRQENVTLSAHLSPIELHSYQEFKNKASKAFVAGDYDLALQNYEKTNNTLPAGHPWRTVSLSNMIVCQLKLGQYRHAIQGASEALVGIPSQDLDQEIPSMVPVKTYKDIWTKVQSNKAEALEATEDYKNAFATYQLLIEKGMASKKILDGRLRCQKVLEPEKFKAPPQTRTKIKSVTSNASSRSPSTSVPPNSTQSQTQQTSELEEQRFLLHDKVEQRVFSWSSDYENNLRELLSRLHLILDWCDWKEVPSSTLVMPKKVKITYLRAAAKTHPDKIQESWPLERKMIAEHVFVILSKAWELFKEEHNIS
ncbi:LAME_0E12684g1_1 [Lachancea meyersii CBS 8951]|uniref:LAME_0E12684g1_1 n=1 Tax=Lachancea meyersii CBS 8951 TaxID=1266667 RepID=A0A1G4JLK2_9SACH|nr:LAME_0E12684g1_1 [Lachancea meyersii CBS 8951]